MRKIINIFLSITMFLTLIGCSDVQETKDTHEAITFCSNILLSINNGTAGSVTLSEEDYNALSEIAVPEVIANYKVADGEGCDGSSYYISLYDANDKETIIKGGYMAVGEEFGATYRAIHDILAPYGIKEIVNAYRATM